MRKYKPAYGKEVDLDSAKTYKYLPNDLKELDNLMFLEIGYALVYMDYFPDTKKMFPSKKQTIKMITHPYNNKKVDKNNCGWQQRQRVLKLIKNFAKNRQNNYENKMWLKEQIFLFQDETENMC